MEGEEVSFFALTDGDTVVPFGSAQDHKPRRRTVT
jgi:phosphoribosylamine--glycine ligase